MPGEVATEPMVRVLGARCDTCGFVSPALRRIINGTVTIVEHYPVVRPFSWARRSMNHVHRAAEGCDGQWLLELESWQQEDVSHPQ